jgi:hypothetical protein
MRTQQAVRDAERRFPVRIRIGIPPKESATGFGLIHASLGANCGGDGWISSYRASSSTGLPVRKLRGSVIERQITSFGN